MAWYSQVFDDLAELREGFWAVVVTFEGEVTAIRYADVRARGLRVPAPWPGVSGPWRTSLNRTAYVNAVAQVRDRFNTSRKYALAGAFFGDRVGTGPEERVTDRVEAWSRGRSRAPRRRSRRCCPRTSPRTS